MGKPDEGTVSVASRVLTLLAADGHLVRGRPRWSWISTQHRWAPTASWLAGGAGHPWSADDARAELVRRWLWLRASQRPLEEALAGLGDDALDEPRLTNWGERLPTWRLYEILVTEQVHHGAEISLLRDLFRLRSTLRA